MKNITTSSRYADKCVKLQADLPATNYTITQVAKVFGGSWYFYRELFQRGFIKKEGKQEYVRWGDKGLPTEKELRKIARRVNTLNRNGHMKLLKRKTRKYTKRSEHWKRLVNLTTDVVESITVDICLGAIEREVKAHRANGVDATHLKNIARISADLVKIMQ